MTRARDFDDDGKILRDGERLRVPMTARDTLSPLQRSVAASTADRARVTDGTDDWRGMQRPGYRMQVDDRERSLVDEAYRQRDLCDANAWRSDAQPRGEVPPTGFGSHGPRGQQVGDVCMTNDKQEGRLKKIGGQFVCVPLQDENDSLTDHRANMQRLYDAHDRELENAWRKG